MTATIDKFGRIVIPKKIRQILGLEPGTTVELQPVEDFQILRISPVPTVEHTIRYTDWGFPYVSTNTNITETFSIPDFIKQSRDERADKISGNND